MKSWQVNDLTSDIIKPKLNIEIGCLKIVLMHKNKNLEKLLESIILNQTSCKTKELCQSVLNLQFS